MHRETQKQIIEELRRHPGITYEIRYGGKHPRVVMFYEGRERYVVFSGTRVDVRGMKDKITDLRHAIQFLKQKAAA